MRPEVARIVGLMFSTQLVIIVTPATSVSFFRPEFDDFLYAPIGADEGEMPLSVLSALARSDLDPWQEAAELSDLPKDCLLYTSDAADE